MLLDPPSASEELIGSFGLHAQTVVGDTEDVATGLHGAESGELSNNFNLGIDGTGYASEGPFVCNSCTAFDDNPFGPQGPSADSSAAVPDIEYPSRRTYLLGRR